jgi:hypothetical protein
MQNHEVPAALTGLYHDSAPEYTSLSYNEKVYAEVFTLREDAECVRRFVTYVAGQLGRKVDDFFTMPFGVILENLKNGRLALEEGSSATQQQADVNSVDGKDDDESDGGGDDVPQATILKRNPFLTQTSLPKRLKEIYKYEESDPWGFISNYGSSEIQSNALEAWEEWLVKLLGSDDSVHTKKNALLKDDTKWQAFAIMTTAVITKKRFNGGRGGVYVKSQYEAHLVTMARNMATVKRLLLGSTGYTG